MPADTLTPPPPPIVIPVTQTFVSTPTFTPSPIPLPIPTPTWVYQGPGAVIVPILLYHHIAASPINSQYYVAPEKFDGQMQLLNDWGYITITMTMLAKAIDEGAELPPRPVLITFDDGNLDNYTNAFPIMQKYGFTGVLYLVGNYLDEENYLNVDQVKEMVFAGWEVGSHSQTHPDLTKLKQEQRWYEISESRKFLERELSVPVLTFSYPFGEYDCGIMNSVYSAGYSAGVGLGNSNAQCKYELFALHRDVVKGTYTLDEFLSFLPWQETSSTSP